MPSLQANHTRRCALGGSGRRSIRPQTAAPARRALSTTWSYVSVSTRTKRPSGRDRQQAEIALYRLAAAIEDGDYRPRPTIGFVEWADRWLASLERKPSTVGSYRSTIVHAKETFGDQRVRRIGAEDIARFNGDLRERAARRRRALSICGCSARASKQRFSTDMPTRTRSASSRPHRGLARSGRKQRTSRTPNFPGSSHTSRMSRTGLCAWLLSRQGCGRENCSRFAGATSISSKRWCVSAQATRAACWEHQRTVSAETSI